MNNTLCFVGSNGLFSLTALQTLLAQKINISQILLAGYAPATPPDKGLAVSSPPLPRALGSDTSGIPAIAAHHDIPIHYVGNDINHFSSSKDFTHNTPPDFLFVACFPFRLPAVIRQWPKKWAINLHPSLLPTYRGPNPVFWQLQHGEHQTGFSLHLLVEALDAGPILFQKSVHFPQGSSRNELDTLLAHQGAEAFCALLSSPALKANEQDSRTASYHPLPEPEDYTLEIQWSAERAFNFICGTHTPDHGYPILLNGRQHHIHSALGFELEQSLDMGFISSNDEILIQFSPGVLRAKAV